ncbi:MAG TPA: asparagine synthase-related protein [Rhodocyclaceae bacterium]|nr:asparagine synthase-related protein [Rhodocyclaceae bacterium]
MPHLPGNLILDFSGHIHNLGDLRAKLGLDGCEYPGAPSVLQAAWQRWGTNLAEHLVGDYALALRDEAQGLIYLARDPLGVKPLYYRIDNGQLSHGFTIPELRRRCPLPVTADMDWAAAYMLDLSFSQTETAYKEINKLAPGHWLSCDAQGHVRIQRYHDWRDDAPQATRRDPRWVEAYREVLEEAIRCRMDPEAPMGAENSGGLDSASITAYLAHFLGEPGDRLHSFGFACCEQEPAYILETSQAKRIVHNYLITACIADDEAVSLGLNALGYPQEHPNSTGHIPFYRECKTRGIRSLFSGFGGDEVVTQNGHQLRQELLDGGHYAALWNILPGDPLRRILRLLKTVARGRTNQAYNPLFLAAWKQRWPHQLLRPEVVERLNLYERYMETARHDAPYRRINDFILQHHLRRMQITARLENCTLMAAAYGVDYRWPLWDARLVQQYLSTPSIEKVGPKGVGRYLHRRAIDGIVPQRVAWKREKLMGENYQLKNRAKHFAQMRELGRQLAGNLHPGLAELIDQEKFRRQIDQMGQMPANDSRQQLNLHSINHIRWLDRWLHRDGNNPG